MKEKKITSPEDILKVHFSATLKGYAPLEVDTYLDAIYDYVFALNRELKKAHHESEKIEKLLETNFQRIKGLELEVISLKTKLAKVEEGVGDASGNLELLQRIRKLEEALFKAGIDPKKVD